MKPLVNIQIILSVVVLTLSLAGCQNSSGWTSGVDTPELSWVLTEPGDKIEVARSVWGNMYAARTSSVKCASSGTIWVSTDHLMAFSEDGEKVHDISWPQSGSLPDIILMDMTIDNEDNIYVLGVGGYYPDLAPGLDISTNRETDSEHTTCLIKLDSNGDYLWGHTWTGMAIPESGIGGYAISSDAESNCYTVSYYAGAVGTPDEGTGIYVVKHDKDGNEQWRFKYDSPANDIVTGSDCFYMVGYFDGTTDFDPGAGVDSANTMPGGYLAKFNSDGDYQWARMFRSGMLITVLHGVDLDREGNVYVVGGENPDQSSSQTYWGFLGKISPDGDEIWYEKWAGDRSDCHALSVNVSLENEVYVSGIIGLPEIGMYSANADLNPGSETDFHRIQDHDVYLSKFDSDGNFDWAATWGGSGTEWVRSVVTDDAGGIYVLGSFTGSVDFDPGPGSVVETTNEPAVFLVKFK